MKKIFVFFVLASVSAGLLFMGCGQKTPDSPGKVKVMRVKVIEGSNAPVIGADHPGCVLDGDLGTWNQYKESLESEDPAVKEQFRDYDIRRYNEGGFENGYVELIDGVYHMLTPELYVNGGQAGYWTPARVGHWTSADGDVWERQSTIVYGDNSTGIRDNTWCPTFYWNTSENAWSIYWRGSGAIFRHKSVVSGRSGIYGPYREEWSFVGDMEGISYPEVMYGISSIGNFYTAKDGRLFTFITASNMQNGKANWSNSLAYSSSGNPDGPWVRLQTPAPVFNFTENPVVAIYDGIYYCVFDDLIEMKTLGIGWSEDGINWNQYTLDLELGDYVPWSANNWLVTSMRTAYGIVKEDDGNFSIWFSAFQRGAGMPYSSLGGFYAIGKIRVSIEFGEEESREAARMDLIDEELWTEVTGRWLPEYDGLSVDSIDKPFFTYALNEKVNGDFTAETFFRSALTTAEWPQAKDDPDIHAGLFFGQKNLNDAEDANAYYVFVSAKGEVKLYRGDDLLKSVDTEKRIAMHRLLRVAVAGKKLSVWYDGEKLLEYHDLHYTDGYIGLVAGRRSHFHFKSFWLRR